MTDGPQDRAEIKALLEDQGHNPSRHLGQNFLADPTVVERIIEVAGIDGSAVVEIGAGTGTLTRALAARASRVVAYEIDAALIEVLDHTLGTISNVEVRHEDASKLDLGAALEGSPWTMVANLPYNVGTGIVLDALRSAPHIERFVVMVQQEVADRMLASSGTKVYGLPSVVVALHASGHQAFSVPPHAFEPQPRVDSAVVVLDRIPASPLSERAIAIAASGFGQRRKMLRRSLTGVVDDPVSLLHRTGIDPTLRAERLDASDWVALAEASSQA